MLEPFKISVPDEDVLDLRRRLERTRWAEDFANETWRYGMSGDYLYELVEYWLQEFDWRAQESAMNRYQHLRGEVGGVPVHVLVAEGKGKRRVPILLNHGWPWTFWDFERLIGPLTDPASVGAPDDLAFDVIVPSLPGFGFSSPLQRTGMGPAAMADVFHSVMTKELGYQSYAVHGGDYGSFVAANLGHAYADSVIGVHLSLPALLGVDFASNTAGSKAIVSREDYAPEEAGWWEQTQLRLKSTRAHSVVHRSAPQTLGFAFNDSPVGLAAWIVERRRLWSDCDGDLESVYSKDFLLTLVSIYWFTNTITTSMRAYADMGLDTWAARHDRTPTVDVPCAVAVLPRDNLLLPKTLVAQHMNLQRWTPMPRGGHFAASEQPELISNDIRAFFADLLH